MSDFHVNCVLTVASLIALAVGVLVYRAARRKAQAAERLLDAGWRMVGFSFIGGPIMVPPQRQKERK